MKRLILILATICLVAASYAEKKITYTASEKLPEITENGEGLHINAFDARITSHKFKNRKGTITFEGNVSEISTGAFKGCSGLTSIEIPNSVKVIREGAFEGCKALTSIKVDADNQKYDSRDDCNAIIETATGTLLAGCQNTIIPIGVKEIGREAFKGCSGLTSIEIPNSVKVIGEYAYKGCSGLTSIEIPNSVKVIREGAFEGCSNLTSIEIPNSVTSIEGWAFNGCKNIAKVFITQNVGEIGNDAFANIGPKLYIEADERNTHYCSENGSLYSKDKTRLIHVCEKDITEFNIPAEVKKIASCAFQWSKLNKVIVPEGVADIENNAFWRTSIGRIDLPASVKKIGRTAFKNCETTEIHLRQEDPNQIEVESNAFYGCAEHCTLYVPIGTGYAYRHHPIFGEFKEVVIEK